YCKYQRQEEGINATTNDNCSHNPPFTTASMNPEVATQELKESLAHIEVIHSPS
ncbi:12102_t:CDS:2, partial [Entrophospora sp. SA101]